MAAWRRCPPICLMVRSALGIKPEEEPSTNFAELLSMFPGGVIK